MTLTRHLIHHFVIAALQATIIVVAMFDRAAGVGAVIGLGIFAVASAIRGYRRDRRRAAESRELDTKLASTLAQMRRRGIRVIDVTEEEPRTDEEPRYS